MPLKSKIALSKNRTLIIWEMTESYDFYKSNIVLSRPMEEIYGKISHPNRKKEWLASKYIIQSHIDCGENLEYLNDKLIVGRSGIEVSISHNNRYCCVLLSDSRCGIDLEKIDRNFDKVSSRFLSEIELDYVNTQRLKCVAWCAKEAIYKMISTRNINFKTAFTIESTTDDVVNMKYENRTFKLGYFQFDDCIICYTIDTI